MQDIIELKKEALKTIALTQDTQELENIRVEYLGKKSKLTDILKGISKLPPAEKSSFGQEVNQTKRAIVDAIEYKYQELKEQELNARLLAEDLDVTLPGRNRHVGSLHPITQIKQRIVHYFMNLGFDVVEGPEIETDYYNFQALNIPPQHPARAMQDTFYFGDGRVLRTHTSPVQIHAMEHAVPPFRLIAPGRVYRCESDQTHTPMFHQCEGLLVSQEASMATLKGVLSDFFHWFFGKELAVRFRPSYFPFTEPSAELDLLCAHCEGKGCRTCKLSGWLEVGGCGMVHPHVLEQVGISTEAYQGWAFGIGMDRLAMLYYGIEDLRSLFENDIAFLKQF